MPTNLLSLFGHIQQQGDMGAARGKQSRLAELASQAYGAPTPQRGRFVQQAIGVDPQAGFALGQQLHGDEDQRMQRVGQMAGFLLSAPEQSRAAIYSNQIVPEMHKLGLGDGLPDQWSDDLLPSVQQIAQQLGASGGDELKSLRVGANGNYWAIRGGQFVDTGTPAAPTNQVIDTGNGFFGVDKRTLNAQPVTVGQRAPGEVPFSIDPNLPPEIQAAIRANPNAGSPDGIASLDMGGQQLRSAPDESEQVRLRMEAERLRLAQEAADRAGVPAGYRQTASGLEPIPGGPADPNAPKPMSASQQAKISRTAQKDRQLLQANEAQVDQTVKLIDGILANRSDLRGVTGMGRVGSMIPGTDWADLAAKLDTLKGRSAFGALQQMRANSPTGGALGQVSERELYLLQNAETQLQQSQSPEALAQALRDYKAALLESKRRMREGVSEFYSEQGEQASPQGGAVDDLLNKYGVK